MSRQEFEARFPDDDACARYLAERRWPDGFVCPACGGRKGWALDRGRPTWECAACRRQTSVTAGTIMHRSHLPLKTWFLAAHGAATHSGGISALQLQAQLGIGSYKTAWLLLHKLRRAMVDPGRSLLQTLVEIDETESRPHRSGHRGPTGHRNTSGTGAGHGQGHRPPRRARLAGGRRCRRQHPDGQPRRYRRPAGNLAGIRGAPDRMRCARPVSGRGKKRLRALAEWSFGGGERYCAACTQAWPRWRQPTYPCAALPPGW